MKIDRLGITIYAMCILFILSIVVNNESLRFAITVFVFIAGVIVAILDVITIRTNEVKTSNERKNIL